VVIVTDVNVHRLWCKPLVGAFQRALGTTPPVYVIPAGEGSKSRETKSRLEAWMFEQRCFRDAVVVALGGGVVGDLAGFVAATYMRGVKVVQVPTSLLAMVDSSIGGKTAIDVPAGKNLVGAFHHPKVVVADVTVLDTLPDRELSNGLSEAIKHAAICDEALFSLFETQVDAIMGRDQSVLSHVIFESMKIKGAVVNQDEREGGLRAILNLGHTIGHGIEAIMQPKLLHGECCAIGHVKGAEVARAMGICSAATVGRLSRALKAYGLPVEMPDPARFPRCTAERVLRRMVLDKKNTKGTIRCVLLDAIGSVKRVGPGDSGSYAHTIAPELLRRVLSPGCTVRCDLSRLPTPVRCAPGFTVPGSKSLSNRLLLLAGLSRGACRLRGLLASDDTEVMMTALEQLGLARFAWEDNGATLVVEGTGGQFAADVVAKCKAAGGLYMGNAGTATRFIQSVLTLVGRRQTSADDGARAGVDAADEPDSGAGAGGGISVLGSARALARPQGPLVEALKAHGCRIDYAGEEGHLPLVVHGGGLPGGTFRIAGKVSSQFVSSVLLSAPFANEPMVIELVEQGRPTSSTYIDMTVSCMKMFGVDVVKSVSEEGNVRFAVPNNVVYAYRGGGGDKSEGKQQSRTASTTCQVECDASSATYPLAFAAVLSSSVTVHGVGSSSLQGDAGFANGVLEKMGCTVSTTTDTTTVEGPPLYAKSAGLSCITVDMSDLTDAFMTAVAVAVFATGTTVITGIANQHVKECDRIAAMCDNLARMGITARNLPDGIEVDGIGDRLWGDDSGSIDSGTSKKDDGEETAQQNDPLRSCVVDCYDDHRIAMSFAVVGAAAYMLSEGRVVITIDDKACTAKTYPNFWDDIVAGLGLLVDGVTPEHHQRQQQDQTELAANKQGGLASPAERANASIVIIGMRAAGKTTLSKALHAAKNQQQPQPQQQEEEEEAAWTLLDLDEVLEAKGRTVAQIVAEDGWEGFRREEEEILRTALREHPTHHILSCGGGVVESPGACKVLREHWPVVQVKRHIDDIINDLEPKGTERRPNYAGGESVRDVWNRRKPLFAKCSTHEFTIFKGDDAWSLVERDFLNFIQRITRGAPRRSAEKYLSPHNNFVCLTLPDLSGVVAAAGGGSKSDESACDHEIVKMLARRPGADTTNSEAGAGGSPSTAELRVDLLRSYEPGFVQEQLAILRRISPPDVAIIFTIRTEPEGGQFPIEERAMFELMRVGPRAGVEFVDVETRWSNGLLRSFLVDVARTQPHVGILGSVHAVRRPLSSYRDADLVGLYDDAADAFHDAAAGVESKELRRRVLDMVGCIKVVGRAEQEDASARIHAAAHAAWNGGGGGSGSSSVISGGDGNEEEEEEEEEESHVDVRGVAGLPSICGVIGICTKRHGALSRVLNASLGSTPVCSPYMATKAAPGQISQDEILAARKALGLVTVADRRFYCLFGYPISKSPSPTMHNAAFRRLGLPHRYGLVEVESQSEEDMAKVKGVLARSDFGGASVTIPLKEAVVPLMDDLSESVSFFWPLF
jgi:pentafunctional AROM polypeptide